MTVLLLLFWPCCQYVRVFMMRGEMCDRQLWCRNLMWKVKKTILYDLDIMLWVSIKESKSIIYEIVEQRKCSIWLNCTKYHPSRALSSLEQYTRSNWGYWSLNKTLTTVCVYHPVVCSVFYLIFNNLNENQSFCHVWK